MLGTRAVTKTARIRDLNESMEPNVRAVTRKRPNRVLIALAAAWMILSLAIGGAVQADSSSSTESGAVAAESVQD